MPMLGVHKNFNRTGLKRPVYHLQVGTGQPLKQRLDIRAMEISIYDLEERAKCVSEAKEAEFLDAVFLINYYNRDTKRWGPEPKPKDITPQEVFGEFNEEAYKDALRRSQKLFSENAPVGMAFFKYPSVTISYEAAVKKFCKENPGFNDKCYSLAINAGIRDMR